MKTVVSILGIILLTIALLLVLAVLCDYFQVYIPGVALLIPPDRRPSPGGNILAGPTPSPVIKETVLIIENEIDNRESSPPEKKPEHEDKTAVGKKTGNGN